MTSELATNVRQLKHTVFPLGLFYITRLMWTAKAIRNYRMEKESRMHIRSYLICQNILNTRVFCHLNIPFGRPWIHSFIYSLVYFSYVYFMHWIPFSFFPCRCNSSRFAIALNLKEKIHFFIASKIYHFIHQISVWRIKILWLHWTVSGSRCPFFHSIFIQSFSMCLYEMKENLRLSCKYNIKFIVIHFHFCIGTRF